MIEIKDTDLPITVAEKIITGTKQYNATPLTKAVVKALTGDEKAGDTVDMFDLLEIKEIADHLMTYYESMIDKMQEETLTRFSQSQDGSCPMAK